MNILNELKQRFLGALTDFMGERFEPSQLGELVDMVRPSQDPKFGDYQANCAMPLKQRLNRPPREIAEQIVAKLDLGEMCEPPEIAGPGFINMRLRSDWLGRQLTTAADDSRLGIAAVAEPRTYVIDYSGPNVAKPMHVGHIRSTVIGDALDRTLKFLGHRAIGDNHIGDWGTQFGMIIYGYKNFLDRAAYEKSPVDELARLYRFVSKLVGYHDGRNQLAAIERAATDAAALVDQAKVALSAAGKSDKKLEKTLKQAERSAIQARDTLSELREKLAAIERDPKTLAVANAHADIGRKVLEETAKLHSGDPENIALWQEFLPPCREDIDRIYRRLGVTFDLTLGESAYHDRLAPVVNDLLANGIARESDGAIGIFFDDRPDAPPLLVRKKDGAFLYATTDLATIQYRVESWRPSAILYVVDHRQSLHFEQLFATARKWGYADLELQHISFGTVLGDDGRPFKTRSGDTVGLWGLLDEAVDRALTIVSANDDGKPSGPELSAVERQRVAEVVGIGALKYADLSQNRTTDYVFSYDKMLAMTGNTATYMQYAHARVRSIFARGQRAAAGGGELISATRTEIALDHPAERALGVELLRFAESLDSVVADYRPNHLTNYLFGLANCYSTFYEQCPVLKADTPEQRENRLALCDLTARTLKQGLELLGIEVVDKM